MSATFAQNALTARLLPPGFKNLTCVMILDHLGDDSQAAAAGPVELPPSPILPSLCIPSFIRMNRDTLPLLLQIYCCCSDLLSSLTMLNTFILLTPSGVISRCSSVMFAF